MSEKLFYDTHDELWLKWKPLSDSSTRIVARGLGNQGILSVGAFGTCGNPSAEDYSSWRAETLLPVLEEYDVADKVFNPEIEEWTPTRAPIESIHMARDEVLTVAVTNQTSSHASIMEAGFAAYGGILRGQDVMVHIEHNSDSPEDTQVARRLSRIVLKATEAQYPLFTMTENLEQLAHRAGIGLVEKIRQRTGGVTKKIEYDLPPIRGDLTPLIYLSGTSGTSRPAWMDKVKNTIKAYKDIQIDDSYRQDWSIVDADEELMSKLDGAVQLIAVTSDTESFGALSELGPRVMHADLAGQSIGIYIEPHDSPLNSPTNRTRILAKEHLARLREDFPNLQLFEAKDLEQLAIFGLSEYFKQSQRLERQ
jgi:hypothetical protein